MTRIQLTGAAAAMLLASAALAATPAERCENAKNKEAGRYLECRQKVEAKFALTGDFNAYFGGRSNCVDRYNARWPKIESRAGDGTCPSTGDQSTIQEYLNSASANVAAALQGETLAGQGQRLKTGQISCWNTSGIGISCPGSGQDGEFQKGLDRAYVDNGDGTVTDTRTGLMWEKLSDDGSMHDKDLDYFFPNHLAKAATLNQYGFAGYTDWRIPNVNELQTLVDYGRMNPAISPAFNTGCTPGCTVLTCSCTVPYYSGYWTSSWSEVAPARPWLVEFYRGDIRRSNYLNLAARAVRGGS